MTMTRGSTVIDAPQRSAAGRGGFPQGLSLTLATGRDSCARRAFSPDAAFFVLMYALVLLFAAGLCLSGRIGHAAAWDWGTYLVNRPLMFAGAGLLVLASAAGVVATKAVQRRGLTTILLALAAGASFGFVAIIISDLDTKSFYGFRPGDDFKPSPRYVASCFGVKLKKVRPEDLMAAAPVVAAPAGRTTDAVKGKKLFRGTCSSCHGMNGEGMTGQGKPLITSEFLAGLDNEKALAFLKVGRRPSDPLNSTKVDMPPKGGNPIFTEDDLRDIIAFLRTINVGGAAAASKSTDGSPAAAASSPAAAAPLDPAELELLVPRWVVTPPPNTALGLSDEYYVGASRKKWAPPPDAVAYANAYYLTTQFGAFQAAGIGILFAVVLVKALRGRVAGAAGSTGRVAMIGSVGLTLFWLLVFPFVFVM